VNGEGSLRKAISDDLKKRKHTPYTPDDILVTTVYSIKINDLYDLLIAIYIDIYCIY
jgi:aspartate/methionine/tyrosine aminotransferase